jgi:hypothetical protein
MHIFVIFVSTEMAARIKDFLLKTTTLPRAPLVSGRGVIRF